MNRLSEALRRPVEEMNRIRLAVTSLAVVVAVTVTTLMIGEIGPGKTQYEAEFVQAASLRSGDAVTVAGIQVGTVKGLRLAGDRVVVTFKVQNAVHLGATTRAAIKLTTLLGSRYLELSPASGGELPGRTIPLANTSVPYDLQRTLADATTTLEQIDSDRIAESVSTLAASLQGVPDALPHALDNLRTLSGILTDRREQLTSLLSSTDTLTTVIRNQRAALGSLVLQGRDLLGELAARQAALKRLFASITTLVDRASAVLHNQEDLNEMIRVANELLEKLHNNDALIRNTMQIMPVTLRNMANATGTGMQTDGFAPAGALIDAYMCALSGRSKQFNFPEYFQDCEPVPDPWPGFPPPYEPAAQFPGFPPDTLATNTPAPPPPPEPNSAPALEGEPHHGP
jgi:phospholipid/cholesterol/gamma-HCH transport system substrate-binding protein